MRPPTRSFSIVMRIPAAFGLALGVGLIGPAALAQSASFQGLGDLDGGAVHSLAQGVSANGDVVVGASIGADGPEAFRWTADGGMLGLGDLAGGEFQSVAYATSADGSVVTGFSRSASGQEAFRWTQSGGLVGLGDLPDSTFNSTANGVSADGSVVVGVGSSASGWEAFRWTAAGGMIPMGDLPGGFSSSAATGVSADGSVIVGTGFSASGSEAFRWTAAGGMVGLGDLPGGSFSSGAGGVSTSGTLVVGASNSGGGEAYRWTQPTGMIGLGDLPGGAFQSSALAVSNDGGVVVGTSEVAGRMDAFIWTPAGGIQSLRDVLIARGVDMGGWLLTIASDMSPDGQVIVGYGTNPQGQTEAWRAEIPRQAVVQVPGTDSLLVSGHTVTVRYYMPGVARVNLLYTLQRPFDPDTAPFTLIAGDILNEGAFEWLVPTELSPHVHLRVEDAAQPDSAIHSPRFRIRPLHAARVLPDSTYELFRVDQHGWFFDNSEAQHFPPHWTSLAQFQYGGGLDPVTSQPYDAQLFTGFPNFAAPTAFAGWPAWVRAFGPSNAYMGAGVYNPAYVRLWAASTLDPFKGACYGMTMMAQMAFADFAAFGSVFPTIGPLTQIYSVTDSLNTRTDIREAVAARYFDQNASSAVARMNTAISFTPRRTLREVTEMLSRDDRLDDATLVIVDPAGRGGHALVPYGVESMGSSQYVIKVYDPNNPGDGLGLVHVDSLFNTWAFTGFTPSWGGSTGLFLMDPIRPYYTNPTERAVRSRGGPELADLFITAGTGVTLTDDAGNSAGYAGGLSFSNIPGGYPVIPLVGGPTPPVGFRVPDAGRYRIALTDAPRPGLRAFLDRGATRLSFGRPDAAPDQTDLLSFDADGLLHVRNPDASAKTIGLSALFSAEDEERLLALDALGIAGSDSVRFRAESNTDARLENPGVSTTYAVSLWRARPQGMLRFYAPGIALGGGATHRVRPGWETLDDGTIDIDIDADGDGTFETTIEVANTVANEPPAGDRHGSVILHAPVPNPGYGQIAIRFDLPAEGHVRLLLHDVLGREVAVLVDESRGAGSHFVELQAGRFAAGVYVIRLEAGTRSVTQRLTVVR